MSAPMGLDSTTSQVQTDAYQLSIRWDVSYLTALAIVLAWQGRVE